MTNPYLIPLATVLRQVTQAESDAEWNGQEQRAAALRKSADKLRERMEAGEQWEVLF